MFNYNEIELFMSHAAGRPPRSEDSRMCLFIVKMYKGMDGII